MSEATIESELSECVHQMPIAMQRRVLEYAKSLPTKLGTPGSYLLQFSGCIEESDLELMEAAIEEGCERIDHDEWSKNLLRKFH